jgi:multicomponent K+:H+ antiporter subunit E
LSAPPTGTSRRAAHVGVGWLPHPVLSLLLAAVWLLLQQSLAAAHLIVAAALALIVPRLVHGLLGQASRPRAVLTVLRLVVVVLWDIVVSNVTVAWIVVNPVSRPRPAWVRVPLDTRHPTATTLLASIITMTPGTVSCIVDDERWEILVHALDCSDAGAMAAQIKQRYEQPLRAIFEGTRS